VRGQREYNSLDREGKEVINPSMGQTDFTSERASQESETLTGERTGTGHKRIQEALGRGRKEKDNGSRGPKRPIAKRIRLKEARPIRLKGGEK